MHIFVYFSETYQKRLEFQTLTSSNEESKARKTEILEFTLCSAESDTSLIY